MKKLILVTLFVFVSIIGYCQDIEFKKGFVLVDGKECMKYDSSANIISFQNLNGDDIMVLKFIRDLGDLYVKVVFIESRQEFTSQSYIFTKKVLVEKLIKSNTLVDCKFNEEKVSTFVLKYDEKVEEKYKNNNSTQTIIIKEEPRRSGVNINIGR